MALQDVGIVRRPPMVDIQPLLGSLSTGPEPCNFFAGCSSSTCKLAGALQYCPHCFGG